MNRLRVLATIFVVALAALAIWVAGSGMRTGRTDGGKEDTSGSAYDYQADDVVVKQMSPDGTLQYELTARQITQQPHDGQISAQELVMHRDPPGSPPDGPNRLTLWADRADLPEAGDVLNLQGKVRAQGRLENSQTMISMTTEQLAYNLKMQEVSTRTPVDITWGNSSFHSGDLRLNFKTGAFKVDLPAHATIAP